MALLTAQKRIVSKWDEKGGMTCSEESQVRLKPCAAGTQPLYMGPEL